jgi:nicotinate-nucleotide pyrophosphorylase
LLDNMPMETLDKSIAYIRTLFPQLPIEISGNITKERFGELEGLAQHYGHLRASMGNLTYGAGWIDFSLKIQVRA